MELNLNLKLKDTSEKVKEVEKKVQKAKKPVLNFEDSWKEILSKKNSESDLKKLKEIYIAMKEGVIGREEGKQDKTLTKAEALRQWKVLQELQRESKLEELVKETPDNFVLVQDEETLDEMCQVLASEPLIAVDTETTGLNVYKDKAVGMSFTAPLSDFNYYIPFRHTTGEKQLRTDQVLEAVKPILENPTTAKIFHNAIYDLHILYSDGIEVQGTIHDTQVIAHLMNENEPTYRLKDLAPKYLKCEADTFDVLFGKDCKFAEVKLKYARYYACKDTLLTYELYNFYMRYLNRPEFKMLLDNYNRIEQPLIKEVWYMERTGFCIDMEEVKRQEVQLHKRREDLEKELAVHFGDINFNSVQQLSNVLYKKKKLHLLKEIPPNFKQSTDSKTLKVLAKFDEGCKLLVEYKDIVKHLSSFVEKIPELIQPDGKIHGSFKQTGTVTGRFSSLNPNMQQQPKEARKMFVAPEGSLILGADFSKMCAKVKLT